MDYAISSHTLDSLEKTIYQTNLELLKEVHRKFLSDLDFEELEIILNNKKKKKFVIKKNE